MPHADILNIEESMTISVWVKPEGNVSPTFTIGHFLHGENSIFVGFVVERSAPQAGGAAFVF